MIDFLRTAIKFSTIFLFGATGETINQKCGHLNMGTPGIMCLGGIGGVLGERIYIMSVPASSPLNPFLVFFIPVLFAMLFGAIGGIIFSFFTVTLHCNQNVTGLTLTTFGVGFSAFFLSPEFIPVARMDVAHTLLENAFTWYGKAGWFGQLFLSHSLFTYLGIIIAIATAIIISKTKVGLHLRAVGENAPAADSTGINVNAYRYVATMIGGAISGIGGAFYELNETAVWSSASINLVSGYGWLALCIVIFSMWKPIIAIFASFGFACLSSLPYRLNAQGYLNGAPYLSYIFQMLPYIATIVVLIITSAINSKRMQPPANLGISYFREDR